MESKEGARGGTERRDGEAHRAAQRERRERGGREGGERE